MDHALSPGGAFVARNAALRVERGMDAATFETLSSPAPRKRPLAVRLFDTAAMGIYPLVARLAGYHFRIGTDQDLRRDGRAVLREVWESKGVHAPADLAWIGERYDDATTWIIAYQGATPVGVLGLMDLRLASMALDYGAQQVPAELDLATTRELSRLAVLPRHRGGAQTVMVGLLREMLAWSRANGIERLFAGSTPVLYRVYRRFNPSARLIEARPVAEESPEQQRYFAALRAYGGKGVLYTFTTAGAMPWEIFSRFLAGFLRAR
jgi:hypothetical protein